MRQKQQKGTRVAVPAWQIQEDAFGDGKERSGGELVWLCRRKRLGPAFGGRGWQGWGIPSWEWKSGMTDSPFVQGLGDSVRGISGLSVGRGSFAAVGFSG